ncbi:MAG: cell envelope protein SmpA [Rhodospirillaceae bacterium]|nr:cell envelope protein SmpA [Rhodospirillaceae bacterium]|tara:strand:+ start:97713 stop:98192 length:480 start_codon:yes stop_codon:yes gene_type:complete
MTVNQMQFRRNLVPLIFAGAAALLITTGCEERIDVRGNAPDPKLVAELKPGVHKRRDVEKRLGAPSTIATFDNEVWFYIHGRVKNVSFFKPELLERRVLTVRFDKKGIVQKIQQIDATKLKEVEFVKRETPTKGKELTFIQQIIGNIGKFGNAASDPDR